MLHVYNSINFEFINSNIHSVYKNTFLFKQYLFYIKESSPSKEKYLFKTLQKKKLHKSIKILYHIFYKEIFFNDI